MKNKGWIIFGIFIIAAIIAFAIYKVAGTTNTTITTGGGSTTKATGGLGKILAPGGLGKILSSVKGYFSGLFDRDKPLEAPLSGDNYDNTDYSSYV